MHLDIFRQAEELGLKKPSSTSRDQHYLKPLGFLFVSSTGANTALFIYPVYKGGPFSITTAPHWEIPEWSVLQKGLNDSLLKKIELIALLLRGQKKTPCITVLVTKPWRKQV